MSVNKSIADAQTYSPERARELLDNLARDGSVRLGPLFTSDEVDVLRDALERK